MKKIDITQELNTLAFLLAVIAVIFYLLARFGNPELFKTLGENINREGLRDTSFIIFLIAFLVLSFNVAMRNRD